MKGEVSNMSSFEDAALGELDLVPVVIRPKQF